MSRQAVQVLQVGAGNVLPAGSRPARPRLSARHRYSSGHCRPMSARRNSWESLAKAGQDHGAKMIPQDGFIGGRVPALPGQGNEIPQNIPPGQQTLELGSQTGPVVVQPDQPAHQGLADGVAARQRRQSPAHEFHGLFLQALAFLFLQQAKIRRQSRRPGGASRSSWAQKP